MKITIFSKSNMNTMKKFFIIATAACLVFAAAVSFTSCQKFDDSALWGEINRHDRQIKDHEARIKALENLAKTINNDIKTLKEILDKVKDQVFVKSWAPVKEGDKVVGYTILFSDGKSFTVSNGKDGKDGQNGQDGQTPVIGVIQIEGVHYWTVNGQPMKDGKGNLIPCTGPKGDQGENGKDGQSGQGPAGADGVTPQIRINQTTLFWEVSYDNGKTWTSLGVSAQGPKGDTGAPGVNGQDGTSDANLFESVTTAVQNGTAYLVITLKSGETVKIPVEAA